MIGAIKRRWKSKKAKVLHKGSELSSSSDTCPTSKGFSLDSSLVDDFDKMIKPPSPRQIHPVLEKGDGSGGMKYGGQLPPLPPSTGVTGAIKSSRRSSTLPPNSEEGSLTSSSPPAFIHVNSGRIELISRKGSVGGGGDSQEKLIWRNRSHLIKGIGNDTTRHSWCGSVCKGGIDVSHPRKGMVSLVEEGGSGGPQSQSHHQHQGRVSLPPGSPPPPAPKTSAEGVALTAVLLNPLRERLSAIEELTKGLQGLQKDEKVEYERCLSELAGQVSRAVALQQIMKSEVEKLQTRLATLENHNKAMATMIIPTLMKLHETVVVVKETPKSDKSAGNQRHEDNISIEENDHENQEKLSTSNNKNPLAVAVVPDEGQVLSPTKNKKSYEQNRISRMKTIPPKKSFQSDKEQTNSKKEGRSLTKHRKIGGGSSECRIPRMSNGRLSRSNQSQSQDQDSSCSDSPSPNNKNSNSKNRNNIISNNCNGNNTSTSNNSIKSESISNNNNTKNNNNNNNRNNETSRKSPQPLSNNKANLTPISRLSSLSKPRNDPATVGGSRLPVRKSISGIPTKHPAATSRSLPNHPSTSSCPNKTTTNTYNSPYSSKLINTHAVGKSCKPNFGFVSKDLKKCQAGGYITSGVVKGLQNNSKLGGGAGGKDEGYSTMSSEALAEQEAGVTGLNLKDLKKPQVKGQTQPESLPPVGLGDKRSVHRSSTFNTFREIDYDNKPIISVPSNSNKREQFETATVSGSKSARIFASLPKRQNNRVTTTLATASVFEPTSITTTADNVRIVSGTPYEIQFSESKGDEDVSSWGDDPAETSTSTILWEDSDDSDILFLPIEMSSADESAVGRGSQSTLVPSYTSWTTSDIHSGSSTTTKGEDDAFTLPESNSNSASGFVNGGGDDQITPTNNTVPPLGEGGVAGEKELIEKWMRLEDVRNEVQWEEEWAWDWDGVERVPPTGSSKGQRSTTPASGHVSIVDYNADVGTSAGTTEDEEFWFASTSKKQQESSLSQEINTIPGNNDSTAKTATFSRKESSKSARESCSKSLNGQGQIDSSTWTKSTFAKMKKVFEAEESQEGLLVGDCSGNNETSLINGNEPGRILLLETGEMNVTQTGLSVTTTPEEDESPPPVIEFTREFYRLANYGSNLSFSDNESAAAAMGNTKGCSSGGGSNSNNNNKTLNSGRMLSPGNKKCGGGKTRSDGKMDDKISQTDFTSSFENLSVSSELFTECRNCLEIIKKLVAHTNVSTSAESDISMLGIVNNEGTPGSSISRDGVTSCSSSARRSEVDRRLAELKADVGCSTTWRNVPQGTSLAEVDRILDILSSSESEDLLSPSK